MEGISGYKRNQAVAGGSGREAMKKWRKCWLETPEVLVGKSLCRPSLKEFNSQLKTIADKRHGTERKLQAWKDKRKVGIEEKSNRRGNIN